MIQNIPNAAEMGQTAIRLYFTAWDHVVEVIGPLFEVYIFSVELIDRTLTPVEYNHVIDGHVIDHTSIDEASATMNEYLTKAQPDLHLCYALIQQTMEIALKAKICAVSPFLLLLGSDIKSWARENADFSDFRTIDAADLVRVVNAVCTASVSEQFASEFDAVRKGRNQIQHLGSFKNKIDPIAALDILIDCWPSLFAGKNWLEELATVIATNQFSVIDDDRFNDRTSLLTRVAALAKYATKNQRSALLGVDKHARMFKCWECYSEANYGDFGQEEDLIHTAYMNPITRDIHCVLCKKEFGTRKFQCVDPTCNSNVVLASGDFADYCAVCGIDQNDPRNYVR